MRACLPPFALLLLPALTAAAEPVDYLRDVKPMLAKSCINCHGVQKQRSGLRLDTAANILKGGNSGPAVVPGKSGESLLVQAVVGADGVNKMPPKEPHLKPEQVALLRAWIDQGAKAPADEVAVAAVGEKSKHWAFQPVVRHGEPTVKDAAWVRNPIDRFILARLEKEGIRPSPEADRVTLLRRVHLDLTGLPPSPKELDEFLKDTRPDAYERAVERVLASPHHGERMARIWLDLARYADSNGFTIDAPRSIWPYRDWVINAFNRDLPFDQFTVEQLAGDMLPNATQEQKIATGFHRNTLLNQEGGIDLEQFRVEYVVDRVNTTGSVWLGLTVGCCQCHDHKFDPLSQREYYQFFAFLNSCDEPTLELAPPDVAAKRKRIRTEVASLEKRLKTLDTTDDKKLLAWEKKLSDEDKEKLPERIQAILKLPENGRVPKDVDDLREMFRRVDELRHAVGGLGSPTPILAAFHASAVDTRRSLQKRIAELRSQEPAVATTLVMQERKTPRPTNVLLGGDFTRKGAPVEPGTPAVLPPLERSKPTRLDFARWVVDAKNPLTPRVLVNRLWQHYFGLGIVETENDFGTQGTPPSHPELLDWLASELVARKWSLKEMHRLIVTSAVYRQSSRVRPELKDLDARNRLLARQNRLRLDAEVVRDVALASSGLLSRKIGGPSVFPPQPDGVYRFTQVPRDWRASKGEDRYRRGMYTYFWRAAPFPSLLVFDAPDANTSCTRRNRSNTPLQALTLLNDQGFYEIAQGMAARVLRESGPDNAERVRYAFRLAMARDPSAKEAKRLEQLLDEFVPGSEDARLKVPAGLPKDADPATYAAWVTVSRVLLNLDELITRE